MRKKLRPLGDLEQIVMNVVWAEGCATVRCVCDQILRKRDIAYTTVMTTMDRLAKKNLLTRKKNGKAYEYIPTCSEVELKQGVTESIVNSLVQNYGDLAIAQFINVLDDIDPTTLQRVKEQYNSEKKSKRT